MNIIYLSKRSKRRNRHNQFIDDELLITLWKQGKLIKIDDSVVFRTKEQEIEYKEKLDSFTQAIDWLKEYRFIQKEKISNYE